MKKKAHTHTTNKTNKKNIYIYKKKYTQQIKKKIHNINTKKNIKTKFYSFCKILK